MYAAGDALPVDGLPPGSILVFGPPMTGKYKLILDFMVEGDRLGEGSLFVTTNESAGSIFADFEDRGGGEPEFLKLVDCVSERRSQDGRLPEERVEYVSSPGDVTGLGIGVSEQLRRFVETGTARTRIVLHSLSTLLMYSDVETVFRFLHVLTGRIDEVDGVGLFTIDPTTHDAETVSTIKQLFDIAIELREGESATEVRFVGPNTPDGWTNYESS